MIRARSVVVTVGLLVVSLLLGAIITIAFGNIEVRSTHTYKADFTDVAGMKTNSDVRIAGVPVGRVTGLSLQPDTHHVVVTFNVDSSITLMRGTVATIKYKDLLANRFLELSQGPGDDQVLPPGGEIPSDDTHPALDLDALYNGFQPLFQALSPRDVNSLTASIIDVFQGQSDTVDSLLARVGSLTSTLADNDEVVGALITNLNAVLGTVNAHSQQTYDLISNLQQLVSGLAGDRDQIAGSFQHITDLSVSVANLLDQSRPDISGSVTQVNRLASNINAGKAELEKRLSSLPLAYRLINRQGQYASTFNFYICGVGIVTDANPTSPISLTSAENRCQDTPK
ncbi:MAG TPA: MlaD family protein [Mycobacteriales bacterium]|nr:MlaD family protein [Mycobacteriales bacterium]